MEGEKKEAAPAGIGGAGQGLFLAVLLLAAFLLFGRKIHGGLSFYFAGIAILQCGLAFALFRLAGKLRCGKPYFWGLSGLVPLCGFVSAGALAIRLFRALGGKTVSRRFRAVRIAFFCLCQGTALTLALTEAHRLREDAEMHAGADAFADGDYARAIRLLEPSARKGKGPEAAAWFGAALLFASGTDHDPERAVKILLPLVDQSAMAAYAMGHVYRYGLGGVPRDERKASECLKKATKAPFAFPAVQTELGLAYLTGAPGFPYDPEHGIKLVRAAAETGNRYSLLWLGKCFRNGWGVPEDPEKAMEYYLHPDVKEMPGALFERGFCRYHGLGTEENRQEGIRLIEQAAEKDDPEALAFLGYLYETGRGVEKDPEKAERYLRRAMIRNDPEAMSTLGFLLATRPEPNGEGIALLQESAAMGSLNALYYLALCCQRGTDVKQDSAAALDYCRRAAENGHAEAGKLLRQWERKAGD